MIALLSCFHASSSPFPFRPVSETMVLALVTLFCLSTVDGISTQVDPMIVRILGKLTPSQFLNLETPEEARARTQPKATEHFRASPQTVMSAMRDAGFEDVHLVQGNVIVGALKLADDIVYDQVIVVLEEGSVHVDLLEHKHPHNFHTALEFVNKWNRHTKFSTAYVDDEGDIRMQAEDIFFSIPTKKEMQEFFLTARISVSEFHKELQKLSQKPEL
eukprot:gb/GEZN01011542.1/.p1 GENE.gb/GEZN01011542.1/~~gb/GEZN01011542.1/.p1  ORF type:complete len:217 (-),score=24.90 gb/GEZN01011542.1/:345-995(-)